MSLNNGLNNGSTSSDSTNSVGAITAPGVSSNMPDCSIGAFGLGGHPPPLPKSDIEIENDFNLPVNPVESGSPRKQPTVPLSRQQATVGPCLAELDPAVAQGTVHLLRKHLYNTKLNLTSKFSQKLVFFRQNKRI